MGADRYDVIVTGGGHAGIEAAMAASSLGLKTALITLNIEMIGHMPCNPAVGGLGKSQLVRETDALGGWIGKLADRTAIQFRVLNQKKGAAVQSLRTQNDKIRYRQESQKLLQSQPNLDLIQEEVTAIRVESNRATGIQTAVGTDISSCAVILTPGTFLNGLIHIGLVSRSAGRLGEFPAARLSNSLRNAGLTVGRLKTGTPARLDRRTIQFENLEPQPGEANHPYFSCWERPSVILPQISCYLTYTNENTHEIIRSNLDRSPLYSGKIKGVGPRYCPSIEDKVIRFPEKMQHQIFLEPESLESIEIYANGISTSLPYDIQVRLIQSIRGLEHARLIRPAYAVEYDFVSPTDLKPTLETKPIENLFLAGQINGTSGYEEAAAQGLMAGVNAAMKILDKPPLVLRRDQAYIGILIDDLVTKGIDEPYRMFTSRAEYRLMLRSDNADERLAELGYEVGLILPTQIEKRRADQRSIDAEIKKLSQTRLNPSPEVVRNMTEMGLHPIHSPSSLKNLLRRQDIDYRSLKNYGYETDALDPELIEKLENTIYYEGYIENQKQEVEKFRKLESARLPQSIDYNRITALSAEVRQRLSKVKPENLGQASRIPGITPAALSILTVWIKSHAESDESDRE